MTTTTRRTNSLHALMLAAFAVRSSFRPFAVFSPFLFLLAVLMGAVALSTPAHAAFRFVTNTNNSGAGSLRQAIADAAWGDTVFITVTGTITLTSELVINKNLTINGPGANSLTVARSSAAGTARFRVFSVYGGTVTLSNLIISNGDAPTDGGGIANIGNLTVRNCTLGGNRANWGAGIGNFGTLMLENSTLSGNSSVTSGGGIANTGTVTVVNSTLSDNTASKGGGIANATALTVVNSTLSNNRATADVGGGISNSGGTVTVLTSTLSGNTTTSNGGGIISSGTLTVQSSTLSNNWTSSNGHGGGIYVYDGTSTVQNSTLSANHASSGGGIYNNSGTLTVQNSTLSGNLANYNFGSGIYNFGTLRMQNSILSNGYGNYSGGGILDSRGYNISSDGSGPMTHLDLRNTDPKLDELDFYGGPTKTHRLRSGSRAINAGSNALIPADTLDMDADGNTTEPLPFDQRGSNFPRVAFGSVDIGAFELDFTYNESLKVTTTADEDNFTSDPRFGSGTSLREAINYARIKSGADTINFSNSTTGGATNFHDGTARTITLPSALPDLSDNVTISGPGATKLTVARSSAYGTLPFRIFTVGSGKTVTLSGLTISNGLAGEQQENSGGGIHNSGNLTVQFCILSGNNAATSGGRGGGIYNGGTLTISNSTLSGNWTYTGGGIFNDGTLNISNSTINNNWTYSSGTSGGRGGGIYNSGALTISNSTISGNSAPYDGGGIYNSSTLTVQNSTLSGNSASNGDSIYNSGTLRMQNSILSTAYGNYYGGGTLDSQGYNISSDGTGPNSSTDRRNTDPKLDALDFYGGPTKTHRLQSDSPAINAGNPNFDTTQLPYDQRGEGYARKTGRAIDIGAFEVQFPPNSTPTNIALDKDSVSENKATGTVVGVFSTTDADNIYGDTHTYALVAGDGAGDNTSFTIEGNSLKTAAAFDYETKNQYLIRVQTTDGEGAGFAKQFTIRVTNINEDALSLTVTTTDDDVVENGETSLREALTYANSGNAGANPTVTFAASVTGTIALAGALPDLSTNLTIHGPGAKVLTVRRDTGGDYRIFTVSNGTTTGPTVNISGLTLSNGNAGGYWYPSGAGGGILNDHGTLHISSSTLSGNSAAAAEGGGIYNNGTLTVQNSTFSGNTAYSGGGVFNYGTLTVQNSTFSGNTAHSGGGVFDLGGGIYNDGTLHISSSTLSGNSSGINSGRPVNISNTILHRGSGAGANFIGSVNSQGYNISNDDTGPSTSTDRRNTDPKLGALADNGGPTMTHALLLGSPAINTGNTTLTTDQRGVVRPQGSADDIGAFEFVNSAPTNIALSNSSVTENRPASTGVGALSTTDADAGDIFAYVLVTGTGDTDNASFTIGESPTLGSILMTNASFNFEAKNSYSIRVKTTDAGGLSFEKQFTISVTNVNDPPTNVALSNSSVTENAAAGTTVGTLSSTDDDAGDTFTYALVAGTGDTNNASFSITGSTLKTAASFDFETKNSYSIRVKTTDGGGLSFQKQFTISVTNVNDAPTASNIAVATNEDTSRTFAASDFDAGFSDPDTGDTLQKITITTLPASGVLRLSGVAVAANAEIARANIANLVYAPSANFNGNDSFNYNASDGASFAAANAAVNIVVNAVNDAPSFTKGANQTVNEDAGARTVSAFATNISAGPANENGQTLTFTTTNNNNSLFSVQPATAANGTLTYTPAANANGVATVSVTLQDNGGTANGGINTSAAQAFTITVNAVNDAPVNTVLGTQSTLEDTALIFNTANANLLSVSDVDNASLTVSLSVTNGTLTLSQTTGLTLTTGDGTADASMTFNGAQASINNALNGLRFNPTANASGSATLTLTSSDGPLSNTDTVAITITPVNDAPSFTKGANQSAQDNAGAQTVAGWATAMSAGPANENAQTLNFIVSNNNNALFAVQPAVAANGALSFTPKTDASGAATVTVQIRDSGGTANGGVDTSAAQTFTITTTLSNQAPTNITLAPSTVAENQPAGTAVGTLSTTDPDTGDSFNYSFATGAGSTDNASFSIVGSTLKTAASFNFETKSSYSIRVKSTDAGGLSFEKAFTISVTNVNEAPSNITLSNSTVAENQLAGSMVGTLSGTDADAGDTFTYALVTGTGATDNALFTVTGSTLKTAASFDFETKNSYSIRIRSTDAGGLSVEKQFTITVSNVNEAPVVTSVVLTSAPSINGTYSLSDPKTNDVLKATPAARDDENDSFTFSYVWKKNNVVIAGANGQTLLLATAGNGDKGDSITCEVTAVETKDGGLSSAPRASNAVTVQNSAPTAQPQAITEQAGQIHSGTLTGADADNDPLIFAPAGGPAQGSVTINANGSFSYSAPADYTGDDAFSFTVSDGTATSAQATVSITVIINVNDAPVNTVPVGLSTAESTPVVVSGLSVSDADAGTSPLKIKLQGMNGRMTLSQTAGLTLEQGVFTSSGIIVFTGTLTSINNALAALRFEPLPGYHSPGTTFGMTITSNDLGNSGDGGAKQDIDTVPIIVNAVNDAPVAVANSYTVAAGQTLTVPAATGVLANDADQDGDALTAVLKTNAGAGALALAADGSLTYTPGPTLDNGGTDSFTYVAFDGTHESNEVTVTITVAVADGALDVTESFEINLGRLSRNRSTGRYQQLVVLTNKTAQAVPGPLYYVLESLSANATLYNRSGVNGNNDPYYTASGAPIAPGGSVSFLLEFENPTNGFISYQPRILSGATD